MNPNLVSPGMPVSYSNYAAMPYYQPMMTPPKVVNSSVNIDVNAGHPNAAGMNGAMPFYPGMAQLMQPPAPQMVMPPVMMPPQMAPQMLPVMMPPMMQPQPAQPFPQVMMPPMQSPMAQPMPQAMVPPMAPQVPQSILPPQVQPMPVPLVPQPPAPPVPAIDQAQPQPAVQPQQAQNPTTVEQTQTKSETVQAPASQKVQELDAAIKTITPEDPANSPGFDKQAEALKTISGFINNIGTMKPEEQKGINELLLPNDGRTFKGLAAIAQSDTSSVAPQEKQKADEVRVMSLLTLANLQKYFRQEFDNQLKKENIKDVPSISLGELPAIQTVQEVIKADPNPEVREAGIFALMGVADSNNKKDIQVLKTILEASVKNEDKKSNSNGDEKVKATAQQALEVVNAAKA